MINVLNLGVWVFMVDFEDVIVFSFINIIVGYVNLLDYCDGMLEYQVNGKSYSVNVDVLLLIVCLCGLYLVEVNVLIGGQFVLVVLFDFGLLLFYCGCVFVVIGCGLFYYLFKLESYGEVCFWNEVFIFVQDCIGLV